MMPILASVDVPTDIDFLLQMTIAGFYIWFVNLVCRYCDVKTCDQIGPAAQVKSNKTHRQAFLGVGFVTLILAVMFRATYPPIVTFLALLATYYAVEHFGSLGASREKQAEAFEEQNKLAIRAAKTQIALDLTRREITTLVNRQGTEGWSVKFAAFKMAPVPLTCVLSVWDDDPRLRMASTDVWNTQAGKSYEQFFTTPRELTLDFQTDGSISLYNLLEAKFIAQPDAKVTFVARPPLRSESYLFPCAAPDQLNAISAILACYQMRRLNDDQVKASQAFDELVDCVSANLGIDMDAQEWELSVDIDDLLAAKPSQRLRDTLNWWLAESGQKPILEKSDGGERLILKRDRGLKTLTLFQPNGRKTVLATTRAYHVLLYMNLTIPWFTMLGGPGSPKADLAAEPHDLENRRMAELGTLEAAYVVALVASDKSLETEPISRSASSARTESSAGVRVESRPLVDNMGKVSSPKELQDANHDYAFDLLASVSNPPFERRFRDFGSEDSSEELATQVTLRAYDRLLRNELRHAVPLETYFVGRMLWNAGGHQSTGRPIEEFALDKCFRILTQDSNIEVGERMAITGALRGFLLQQAALGITKNGPRPTESHRVDTVADLIWRLM